MADNKIVWDKSGERRYETGVDHGVLYPNKPDTSEAATKSFTGGVAWNGLTSVSESPSGAEANDIYADNILYASLRSAEKFGGTIESYTYPEEFCKCNGEATPEGAVGLYVGQQKREPFGFCYRSDIGDDTQGTVDPDVDYKLHLWYNCVASPSERQFQTVNESPEAITMSWEISTTPVNVTGMKPTALLTIDSSKLKTTAEKARLQALEDILYGTNGEGGQAPYLPTPDEVIRIMKPTP